MNTYLLKNTGVQKRGNFSNSITNVLWRFLSIEETMFSPDHIQLPAEPQQYDSFWKTSRPSTTTETNFDLQGGEFYAPLDRQRSEIIPKKIARKRETKLFRFASVVEANRRIAPGDPTTWERNKRRKSG
jgi:hypothetical protein